MIALSDVLPLEVWGASILFWVGVLLVGSWARQHVLVYLGHGALMVIYAALFAGTLPPLLSQPYADGFRGATTLLIPVVFHLLFWLRTGPRPLAVEEAAVSEHIGGPS